MAWLLKSGLLAVIAPILEVFLKSIGATINDSQAAKRAEQNAEDLGRITAERDQEQRGREAAERELEALKNAPQTTDDAIARLDEGSA